MISRFKSTIVYILTCKHQERIIFLYHKCKLDAVLLQMTQEKYPFKTNSQRHYCDPCYIHNEQCLIQKCATATSSCTSSKLYISISYFQYIIKPDPGTSKMFFIIKGCSGFSFQCKVIHYGDLEKADILLPIFCLKTSHAIGNQFAYCIFVLAKFN